MTLCGFTCFECAEIASLSGRRVLFSRVQPVFARLESSDHDFKSIVSYGPGRVLTPFRIMSMALASRVCFVSSRRASLIQRQYSLRCV